MMALEEEPSYINTVGPQLAQARLDRLDDLVGRVLARVVGVLDLGGECEPAPLPSGLARERFLAAGDIDARRVDLVVAASLEDVESLVEGVEVGDSRAVLGLGTKGHEAEDDAVRGGFRDERHRGGFPWSSSRTAVLNRFLPTPSKEGGQQRGSQGWQSGTRRHGGDDGFISAVTNAAWTKLRALSGRHDAIDAFRSRGIAAFGRGRRAGPGSLLRRLMHDYPHQEGGDSQGLSIPRHRARGSDNARGGRGVCTNESRNVHRQDTLLVAERAVWSRDPRGRACMLWRQQRLSSSQDCAAAMPVSQVLKYVCSKQAAGSGPQRTPFMRPVV